MSIPGESPWTGKCQHCPARYATRWELEEHERGCARRPTVPSNAAVEALAESLAGRGGYLDDYRECRENAARDKIRGHYTIFVADALGLLAALRRRGYTLTPIVPNAGAGEGAGRAEASQVVYRDAGDFQGSLEALRAAGCAVVAEWPIPEPTEAAEAGVAENTGIATSDTERACSASAGGSGLRGNSADVDETPEQERARRDADHERQSALIQSYSTPESVERLRQAMRKVGMFKGGAP